MDFGDLCFTLLMAAKLLKPTPGCIMLQSPLSMNTAAKCVMSCTCLQCRTETVCRQRVPRCSSLRPCLGEVPHNLTPVRAYFTALQCQDTCIIHGKHMVHKSCIKTFNPLAMILLHLTQQEVINWHDDGGVMQHDATAQQTCLQHTLLPQAKRLNLNQEQNYT